MREVAAFVLLACACGAAVGRARAPGSPAGRSAETAAVPSSGGGADDASPAAFDALASRAPSIAPGMREVARKEGAGLVPLATADARVMCLRAAVAATAPVAATLVDAEGNVLAAASAPEREGVLGERGPVCVRRGDSVKGAADGDAGVRVRWVAWASP